MLISENACSMNATLREDCGIANANRDSCIDGGCCWDADSAIQCFKELNECDTNNGGCDTNALCTNTPGQGSKFVARIF